MSKVIKRPAKLRKAIQNYTVGVIAKSAKQVLPISRATVISLPFTMQKQTQSNWCWAATSTSIAIYYNASAGWAQCLVAKQALAKECCSNPSPCNVPWYLDRALQITGNFVMLTGPLSAAAIQAELQKGNVIGTRIGWNGGSGHFMVIYGCGNNPAGIFFIRIDDPVYGKSDLTLTDYSHNYKGSGSWTHTYFTKP